jgi:arylamine N-acetyltransferase
MITFDQSRFTRASGAFLASFGLCENPSPEFDSLRELYRAFSNLPYENVSKIIRSHDPAENGMPLLRTPDEVLEGYLHSRLGGTCFSLTQCLFSLLSSCGFQAYRVLGDMHHGTNIHCAVVVALAASKYLCDAGYLLPEPVLLDPGGSTVHRGVIYTYCLEPDRKPGIYNMHTRSHAGELRWRYRIRDRAVEDSEFESHWRRSFDLPMNRQLVLTRNLDQAQVYVHKNHLRLSLPHGKKNRNIRSSLGQSIEELFGIQAQLVERAHTHVEKLKEAAREKS